MNIKLEFDDDGVIYELMDIVVFAHLKNTKAALEKDIATETSVLSNYKSDIEQDKKVLAALDVLIGYFGK